MGTDRDADVVVVGAGIVGLASARALAARTPGREVLVVDKEQAPARHQSGRNSGVIHSGIYYRPDSEKTSLVAAGRRELIAFLEEHSIDHEICGKVVVAIDRAEVSRLEELEARAAANDVPTRRLDRRRLREREPHVAGVAALEVPSAGIVDYGRVSEALAAELTASGTEIRFGHSVTGVTPRRDSVVVETDQGSLRAGSLVNCAGLYSDRIAKMAGAERAGLRIMPFRGEYRELTPRAGSLIRNLVYPLPDPAFPFLGVHLTRTIDGHVHAGPNAVPALHREGYRWRDVSLRDATEIGLAATTWRLASRYWRTGMGEVWRSLSDRAFLRAIQRLCPEIGADDLVPAAAGVRAQAIGPRGELLDDFAFAEGPRTVHVVNAPSPAATACLAIGNRVARRHDEMLARQS